MLREQRDAVGAVGAVGSHGQHPATTCQRSARCPGWKAISRHNAKDCLRKTSASSLGRAGYIRLSPLSTVPLPRSLPPSSRLAALSSPPAHPAVPSLAARRSQPTSACRWAPRARLNDSLEMWGQWDTFKASVPPGAALSTQHPAACCQHRVFLQPKR